jgi:hypothetical protein
MPPIGSASLKNKTPPRPGGVEPMAMADAAATESRADAEINRRTERRPERAWP